MKPFNSFPKIYIDCFIHGHGVLLCPLRSNQAVEKLLILLCFTLGIFSMVSAQVLYSENFDGQNGKGATCVCTGQACSTCNICDLSGVSWAFSSAQGGFGDCNVGGMYFRVIEDQMQNVWTGNQHPCWESPVIDVSSVNTVEIIIGQVKNCGNTAMNFSQRFRVYGVRDGTATIFQEYFGFDFPAGHSVTYTDAPIDVTGVDDFQIRVCIVNSGNTQRIWCYDDVTLEVVTLFPVELTNFDGEMSDNAIELKWATGSETNNSGFEVQKSSNDKDWEVIGFVDGNGTTSETNEYRYRDLNPFGGINYYRLRQIDFDGMSDYSKTISLKRTKKGFEVFPNPVLNTLTIMNNEERTGQFFLENNKGEILKRGEILDDINTVNMADLPFGIYYLKIITNEVFVEKIIKK